MDGWIEERRGRGWIDRRKERKERKDRWIDRRKEKASQAPENR